MYIETSVILPSINELEGYTPAPTYVNPMHTAIISLSIQAGDNVGLGACTGRGVSYMRGAHTVGCKESFAIWWRCFLSLRLAILGLLGLSNTRSTRS